MSDDSVTGNDNNNEDEVKAENGGKVEDGLASKISKGKKRSSRRWLKICGGLLGILVLVLLLLPVGVKYYLTDWLVKNGADSAIIKNLRYNPFVGSVMVGGVAVHHEGHPTVTNSHIIMDLGLSSLFSRDIRLEQAEYQDLSLELEQHGDGSWRFGSYTMAAADGEEEVVEPEEKGKPWFFHADQVVFVNCTFHFKSPELDLTLQIDKAELSHLSTRPGQPAGSFTFSGSLDEGPISLKLDSIKIVPELRVEGEVSVAGFKLGELARILADVLPTLVGEVGFDGKLLVASGEGVLQAEYDGALKVKDLDLATGELNVVAESLGWQGGVRYSAADQKPVVIETDGLFSARGFSLQLPGSDLVTEEAEIDIEGKTLVSLGESISVKNDGSLQVNGAEVVLPPYGIVEESLSWQGIVQFDADSSQKSQVIQADGLLELGEFQVGGDEQSEFFALGGKMASWQGALGFKQDDSGKGPSLTLDGALTGGELRTILADPQLRLGQGKVVVTTQSNIELGENLDIKGLTSLVLEDFSFIEGTNDVPSVSFARLEVAELEGKGGKSIGVRELKAEGLKSSVAGDFPLEVTLPELKVANVTTSDLAAFSVEELVLDKPLVMALHNNRELVRVDQLKIEEISLSDKVEVGVAAVRLQNLALMAFKEEAEEAKEMSVVALGQVDLTDVTWSQAGGFAGDTLHLGDLLATIIRDKDGNINVSQQLAAMKRGAEQGEQGELQELTVADQTTTETEESAPAPFKLQNIVVDGKSSLSFKDYTLAVPYLTDLAFSRLELTDLDSSKPDQKTELFLQGELEKRAPIELSGHLFPFKAKPGVDMKLDLKNYPLSSLSAYTVQSVGTALASGQLQLKSKMVLADDELDMSNDILLKKLETETISPELGAELNNQLPIPLDAALSILRDSEKNISLKIPLSGPVSELNVGISDVMITALSKAIVPAASGYLMYALGPYGALAYVGMKVGEKVLQVELPPVVFVQQEIALTEEHGDYLERVGKILQDRPDTDVQICPQVGSWELMAKEEIAAVEGDVVEVNEEQKEQLLELGQQRAKAVQQLLAEDHAIELARLLICDTKIEPKKDMKPAVLLQL